MTGPAPGRYEQITKHCFINAPFNQLEDNLLDLFLEHRLQPEIGLEGNWLWDTPRRNFETVANKLNTANLKCTIHAPFFDLAPGSSDEHILEVSRKKLTLAFELIEVFRPRTIVCHLGYEDAKYSKAIDRWLEASLETWSPLVDLAAKFQVDVMFENTYETSPEIHCRLFEALKKKNTGFCLDVGHLLAFAGTSWQPWLDKLHAKLGQLHLHDNNGDSDEHIAIGQGIFPFPELFDYLRQHKKKPVFTLEPHSHEDLWLSLAAIEERGYFKGLV